MDLSSLLSQITLVVMPFLVFGVTYVIKKLGSLQYTENSRAVIRSIAAVLAFGGIVAGSVANGTQIDQNAIQGVLMTVLQTGIVFFGATGLHEVSPSNNP